MPNTSPKRTVSCVIAALNEEARISEVLRAVDHHPLLSEVIVIDDGSTDGTTDIVRRFKDIKLIRHLVNQGKSKSVADGIEAARGYYICVLDADLEGITADSVTRLITPVLEGKAPISISLRENMPLFWKPINFDILSGERVYPREFLAAHLDELRRLTKFGIETYMNQLIIDQHMPIIVVFLPHVVSPFKYYKEGFFSGFVADIKMFRDIFATASIPKFFWQIYRLVKLKVPESQKFGAA